MTPDMLENLMNMGPIHFQIPCYKCRNPISLIIKWKHPTDDDMSYFDWSCQEEFDVRKKGTNNFVLMHSVKCE